LFARLTIQLNCLPNDLPAKEFVSKNIDDSYAPSTRLLTKYLDVFMTRYKVFVSILPRSAIKVALFTTGLAAIMDRQ